MSIVSPRQTILVTSRAHIDIMGREMQKDDVTATDWHSPISHHPLMYGIILGKDRITLELIRKSRVFVVNFMPADMGEAAEICRIHHGKHHDKFEQAGLTKEEATSVECCRIKEACAYLECEMDFEKEFGDHIFIAGKVRNSDIRSEGKRLFHVSKEKYTTTVD